MHPRPGPADEREPPLDLTFPPADGCRSSNQVTARPPRRRHPRPLRSNRPFRRNDSRDPPAALQVFAELQHRAAEADALRAAYDKACEQHTGQLTDAQKNRISQLATDLPGIWDDPTTPMRERKRITRLLLTDVTVTRTSDTITAHIRLTGGQTAPSPCQCPSQPGKSGRPKPAPSPSDMGFRRAGEFTWAAVAASTLDVYREVAERRRRRRA